LKTCVVQESPCELSIRNLGEYEGDLNIDDRIVTGLLAASQIVADKVSALP